MSFDGLQYHGDQAPRLGALERAAEWSEVVSDEEADPSSVMRWPCSQCKIVLRKRVIEDGRVSRLLQCQDVNSGGRTPLEDVRQLAEESEADVERCDAEVIHCDLSCD